MKVFRSTLFAGAAVLAAACGDKISPPKSVVRSVIVAPASATIGKGASINLTAAVTADPGVAVTPLAWTSSDATKATVDANGKVTGVAATPGVAICAAIGGAQGCASIIVTEVTTIPAQVSIQSITVGNLATPAPIPPAATGGQLNVTLNVNANSVAISKVDVLVDGVVAATQTFTAAQAAALQSASAMVAEQVPPSTIVLSFNSALFDPVTFVTAYKNGLRTISARTTGSFAGSGTASTSTSTNSVQLLFGNADTFAATITPGPSSGATKTAANALGFIYTRGVLNVVANPIIYTANRTIAAGSVNFGNVGCQTALSSGPATAPLVAAGTTFTATLTLAGYEFNGCPLFNATGESVTFAAVDNLGNQFILPGTVPANSGAATMFRIDNLGPPAPILNASTAAPTRPGPLGAMPKGRTSFWLNDVVGFNALATSNAAAPTGGLTSDGFICNNSTLATVGNCLAGQIAPIDLGVGGTVYSLAVAPGTVAATAAAGAALANATTLAPSATNAGYCGVAFAADALGNLSKANPTAAAAADCAGQIAAGNLNIVTFGVDRAPPTIAFAGTSLAANARINTATLGGEFVVTVADTGAVGNSGLAPVAAGPNAGPVLILLQQRVAGGVPAGVTTNRDASGVATTATTPISTNVTFGAPLGSTSITGQSTVGAAAAYWTFTALAQDAAGNQSGTVTRVVAGDNTAAVATAPAVPASITGAFSAAAFLNDNLSLRDYYFTVGYGGGLTAPTTITLAAAPTVIDAYNSATLTNTNFALNASINTFLGLQNGQGASPAAYAAGAAPLNALNLFARDQTQAAYTAAPATVIAATAPATGVSIVNFTGGYVGTSNAPVGGLCALAAASGGCTVSAATPGTVTLGVNATGATGIFNNPFSRVDFYANNGVDLVLIGSVPAASATLVDNGLTRVWTYTLPALQANPLFTTLGGVSGGAPGASITRAVYAFGASPSGTVALVDAAVNVLINP